MTTNPTAAPWETLTADDLISGFAADPHVHPAAGVWLEAVHGPDGEPDCDTVYACAVGELALRTFVTRSALCTEHDGGLDFYHGLSQRLTALGYPIYFLLGLSDGYEWVAEEIEQRDYADDGTDRFTTDPAEFAALLDAQVADRYVQKIETDRVPGDRGYVIGAQTAFAVRPRSTTLYPNGVDDDDDDD